jgi:rhomboid protease GluP
VTEQFHPSNAHPDTVEIRPPDSETALRWSAALAAREISHRFYDDPGGPRIELRAELAERALAELRAYQTANTDWPPAADPAFPHVSRAATAPPRFFTGAVMILLLAVFHWLARPAHGHWVEVGGAESSRIVAGEWWRAVTALTLHADTMHLLTNSVCLLVFVTAVSVFTGAGAAWLLTVLAGAAANASLAAVTDSHGWSYGASTAVFAALGTLAVLQVYVHFRDPPRITSVWHRSWIALAAAMALLALLGTGPGTDVAGHAAGFAWGLAAGLPAIVLYRHPVRATGQLLMLGAALAAVLAAWHMALRFSL